MLWPMRGIKHGQEWEKEWALQGSRGVPVSELVDGYICIPDEQCLLGSSCRVLIVHYNGFYGNTATNTSPSTQSWHPLLAETLAYNQHFYGTISTCFTGLNNYLVVEEIKKLQPVMISKWINNQISWFNWQGILYSSDGTEVSSSASKCRCEVLVLCHSVTIIWREGASFHSRNVSTFLGRYLSFKSRQPHSCCHGSCTHFRDRNGIHPELNGSSLWWQELMQPHL